MKKILCMLLACVMVLGMVMPMATLAESTESTDKTVYANGKVWFDLNGNSKLFINTNSEEYKNRTTIEFLAGVDYAGYVKTPTGNFATDKAAIMTYIANSVKRYCGGAAMPYTVNANTATTTADFKTDTDNNYWFTFEENSYLVRPTEKVIKLVNDTIDTSNIKDEELAKRYASLNEGVTIDVPDGKYKTIGFLKATRFSYSKRFAVSFKYKEDAVAETVKIDSYTVPGSNTAADLAFRNLNNSTDGTADWNCQHALVRIELNADPTKTLESIHIKDDGKNKEWTTFILSAWGEETTLAEKIAELTSLNPANITAENYETVKASVEEIDTYLVNYNTALTEEQKLVYDIAKANLSAYEKALAQEKLYAANTEWFDLNGNAKFFINKEDTDAFNDRFNMIFLPGVDYSGFVKKPTGVFATDKAATTSYGLGGAAMPYTIDNNPATLPTNYADFVTGEDGNLWYTFEENTYLMRPEEKVIKVAYEPIDTSALSDTETIERYQSLKRGTTVDVPDKNYENIGLLLAIRLSYSKALEFSFYYKGEAEPVVKRIDSLSYGNTSTADLTFAQLASSPLESWNVRHAFTRVVLDSEYIDSSKVLEKIHISDYGFNISTGAKKNHAWPGYIISMWGDEVNLEGKIDTLEALIAEGIADREEFLKAKGIVETIDNDLAEKGITNSALKAEDKAVYDEAKAAVEGYKATFKAENVNLVIKAELEFEGNSRLFVEADDSVYTDRANYKDYLPGVDFAGFVSAPKGDFATDQSKVTLPNQGGAMFVYTVNKYPATEDTKTIPDFSLIDGKHYWTVDGVPYLVRVNKNVIKLAAGACTIPADMDESKKARYKSLKEGVVVDVPDGKYNSIGFLAGAEGGWRKSYDITLYYEGEENPVTTTVTIDGTMNKAGASYKEGTLNLRTFLGTTTDNTDINFVAQEVTADSSKVLTAVKFADNIPNGHNPTRNGIIVSVWGKQTIKGALSEINENTSKKEIEIIVDAIEKTLAENDITADDLTDETKAKYNLAKVAASALEVKSAEFADSKVTVSYETGVDTGAKVIVAEYDDEDETLFNKATIIPVEFNAESKVYEAPFTATGSKVKVFVWKDMINFFPYK